MITIVIGCMYAGKTTYLLEKINYLKEKNSSYLVINHSSDTRYNDNCITNHNQESVNSLSLIKLCDLNIQNLDNIDNLLIDEAQFFTDLYDTVLTFRNYKKTLNIILVGLDGDYKQNVFNDGQLLKLIPHCEELTKLYSKCYICEKNLLLQKELLVIIHKF